MNKEKQEGKERRRRRRFSEANCELKILRGEQQLIPVQLRDISLDGIGIVSPRKLEVGEEVQLSVVFPEEEPFLIRGRIVWCNESGKGYSAGMQFEPSES